MDSAPYRVFALTVTALAAGAAMAIETPAYEVLLQTAEYEVRGYAPMLVAEVDMRPGADDGGFRVLADYIFGNNTRREAMAMTAPVVDAQRSEKMAMTAPVMNSQQGERTVMRFVMETKYTRATLPQPNDSRVRIVELPARTLAVRRYHGGWSMERFGEERDALLAAVARDGLISRGAVEFARYDPPFMPWFMRTNDVWVEIVATPNTPQQ